MNTYFTADHAISLLTLTGMEIVLGVDNIIFIAILVGKVPHALQDRARRLGLGLALVSRLALLFSIAWVMRLTQPLFNVMEKGFSGRDLILIAGGLFLLAKATHEIHEKLEGPEEVHMPLDSKAKSVAASGVNKFYKVLLQIMILDIVFSLDSVITAVGMAQQIWIMVTAMLLSMVVMLFFAKSIGDFVMRHPTIKILALSFLLLIGLTLFMDGMGTHVNKAYIYFAMAFSLSVEILNLRYRKKHGHVALRSARSKKT